MELTTSGMDRQTHDALKRIAQSLRDAGYDPYEQLIGYIKTGDVTYITRRGDARTMIRGISMEQIARFTDSLLTHI